MEKTLCIPKETVEEYNRLMRPDSGTLDYIENDIPRYATIAEWTVKLGNGFEVDIKVCSSNDGDPL